MIRMTDEQLEALLDAARDTKSQAVHFDPETGGFRVLTPEEDWELIDAIRLPEQRYDADRAHVTDERDTARALGDVDGADAAEAHLEVLDAERRLAQRYAPEVDDEEWER